MRGSAERAGMGDEPGNGEVDRRTRADVAHPNTTINTIAAAVASGVNMNEWVFEAIECSGAGSEPFTDAQFESVARLVAAASKAGRPRARIGAGAAGEG